MPANFAACVMLTFAMSSTVYEHVLFVHKEVLWSIPHLAVPDAQKPRTFRAGALATTAWSVVVFGSQRLNAVFYKQRHLQGSFPTPCRGSFNLTTR